MTKTFCDVCCNPAFENRGELFTKPVGKPWRGYRSSGGSGCDGTWQPQISIGVYLRMKEFKNEKDGDPPDICLDCLILLLGELKAKLESIKIAECIVK